MSAEHAADPATVVPPRVLASRWAVLALGYYFPVEAQRPTNEPGKPPGPKARHRLAGYRSPGRGPQPQRLHPRRAGRHRDHRLPPLGDGPGHPQLAAGADRGRTRRADGAREDRAGRRGQGLRRPEHRRLEQHPRHLRGHAPSGRDGAHDARRGGGEAMERARRRTVSRGITRSPISPRAARSASESWRSRPASRRCPQAKDVALRPVSELHAPRQAAAAPRRARVCHRPGDLRRGHEAPGDAHRRHRAPAGRRRQGRAVRCDASAGGPGRSQGDRDPAAEAAIRLPAVGRGRRDCGSHVGRHARPRRARHRRGSPGPNGSYDSDQYREVLAKAGRGAREPSRARWAIRRRR